MSGFIQVTEEGNYGWPMLVNVEDISNVRRPDWSSDGNAVVYFRSAKDYITVMETVDEIAIRIARSGAAMSDWEPIELRMTFEKLESIIRADERERIAHAIEAAAERQQDDGFPYLQRAARIARSGSSDE